MESTTPNGMVLIWKVAQPFPFGQTPEASSRSRYLAQPLHGQAGAWICTSSLHAAAG